MPSPVRLPHAFASAVPWVLLALLAAATVSTVGATAATIPAGIRVSQAAGRRVDPPSPQHRVVHGGPPCNRNAYLAPTPPSVEAFVTDVERSPYVYLVRLRNDEHLPCRVLASTWEKIIVVLKDKVRIVELHMNRDPAAKAIALHLNLTRGDGDLPYMRLFDGRPAPEARREAHRRDVALLKAVNDGDAATDAAATCEGQAEGAGAPGSGGGCGADSERLASAEDIAAARRRVSAVASEPHGEAESVVLLHGRGTSHAAIREAVETRIKSLARDAGGRAYKRDVW